MKKYIFPILAVFALLVTGCSNAAQPTSSAGTSVLQIESVDDLLDASEVIVLAKYTGNYEIVGHGNGVITIGETTFDDTSYYALCDYDVLQVVQGDTALEGTTITVKEYLGVGEEAGLPMVEADIQHDVQWMAENPNSSGNPAWQEGDPIPLNETSLLLCMTYNAEESVYTVPIPEKCIHSVNDDTIKFSNPLEGDTGEITLGALQTMAEEAKR